MPGTCGKISLCDSACPTWERTEGEAKGFVKSWKRICQCPPRRPFCFSVYSGQWRWVILKGYGVEIATQDHA